MELTTGIGVRVGTGATVGWGGGVAVGTGVATAVACDIATDVGLAEDPVQAETSSKATDVITDQYASRSIVRLYGRAAPSANCPGPRTRPHSPASEHIEKSNAQCGGAAKQLGSYKLELVLQCVDSREIVGQEDDNGYPSPLEGCVIAAEART